MSRRIAGFMVGSLLVITAAAATDPWIDKDFKDWNAQDVQRILTDSPWAKPFQSGMTSGSTPTTVSGPAAPPGYIRPQDKDPMVLPTDLGGGATQSNPPVLNLTVGWFSSRTIREAAARKRELLGTPIEEARKDLAKQYDTYEIVVLGPNLTGFAKEGADSLKAHTYLVPKRSKEKIVPTKVTLQMGADGFRPIAIIFEFSRKTATGEPTIGARESGIDFVIQVEKVRVKVSFDISKMADKKGTDL